MRLPLLLFLSNIFYTSFSNLFYYTVIRFFQLRNIFLTAPVAGGGIRDKKYPLTQLGVYLTNSWTKLTFYVGRRFLRLFPKTSNIARQDEPKGNSTRRDGDFRIFPFCTPDDCTECFPHTRIIVGIVRHVRLRSNTDSGCGQSHTER